MNIFKIPALPKFGGILTVMTLFYCQTVGQEVQPAQPAPELSAHLDFPPDLALDLQSAEGVFELVQLTPGTTATVTITWPPDLLGHETTVEPLDGGAVSLAEGQSFLVSADRTTTFSFATGGQPGQYRLHLRGGDAQWEMSFSVPNLTLPDSNPGAVIPEPPELPVAAAITPEPTSSSLSGEATPEPTVAPPLPGPTATPPQEESTSTPPAAEITIDPNTASPSPEPVSTPSI